MGRFFRLIKNEYVKLWRQVSSIILLVLLIVSCIGINIISKMSYYGSFPDWYSPIRNYVNEGYDKQNPDYDKIVEVFNQALDSGNNNYIGWNLTTIAYVTNVDFKVIKDSVTNNDFKKYATEITTKMEADIDEFGTPIDYDINYATLKGYLDRNETPSTDPKILTLESEYRDDEDVSDADIEENNQLIKWQIDNNKPYVIKDHYSDIRSKYWEAYQNSVNILVVIGIMCIVFASNIIAQEFSNGTIKFLLINPVKRWKILMSKYATVISILLGLVMITFILQGILGMLFFGTDTLNIPYIYVEDGAVKSMSALSYCFGKYLNNCLSLIVMTTLSFAISSLLRSSSLSLVVSMASLLIGTTIVSLLKDGFGFEWARYLLFANLDLNAIIRGEGLFAHHSFEFAIGIIAIHMVIFLLTAWDSFTRKEV